MTNEYRLLEEESYNSTQESRTFQNVVISGILATQALGMGVVLAHNEDDGTQPYQAYYAHLETATGGANSSIVTAPAESKSNDQFVGAVTKFYSALTDDQETLGADFEKILNDNLWDLYES